MATSQNEEGSKSLSRRNVKCGKCDQSFSNRTNLKIHYDRKHPKEKVLEKGQSVLDFSKQKKRKISDEGENNNSFTENDHEENIQLDEDTTLEHCLSNVGLTSSNISSNSRQSVISQMQELLDKLKLEEPEFSQPSSSKTSPDKPSSCNDTEHLEIERKIGLCSSLKEISTILDDLFSYDTVNGLLTCVTCISDSEVGTNQLGAIRPGIFNVIDVEEDRLIVSSRKFRNLKSHLIRHQIR